MPNLCGELVRNLRKVPGKSRVQPSTVLCSTVPIDQYMGVKLRFIPMFFPNFPLTIPLVKIAALPLVEHYFYPVSTAPIINSTREN